MQEISGFLKSIDPLYAALMATVFTWALTALGASVVFVFSEINRKILDTMLGFTGGVMVAASFWSLLLPAIEMAEGASIASWVPAATGFIAGAVFLFSVDKILPHLHIHFETLEREGLRTGWNRSILLVLAITLHNIPEGLAVGVAFGAVAADIPGADTGSAIALAIGIGLQNFPEGTAVAVPLRLEGLSRLKSFWWGQLSAVVEPVAGFLGALFVVHVTSFLPYALGFAAGAMIFVVVEEVIPESQRGKYTDYATLGFIVGFTVMMVLDVSLS